MGSGGAGRLAGKVAIVTGAASGIGRAIAEAFSAEGAAVMLVDRDGTGLAATAAGLVARHATRVADVTDGAAMAAAVAGTVAALGPLTTVVTAAGVVLGKRITESTEAEWETTFAVNVHAAAKLIRPAIPAMIAAGGGSVVTLASQLAQAGGRSNCAYVASKGAVIAMTRSIALDFAGDGIRANTLLPGATETAMLAQAFARHPAPETARAASRARHAMGRFGRPEEVAAAAVFLASDEASFVTGTALPVDGGWLVA